MKLVMAILPQEYSDHVLNVLMDAEYRATRISTAGGLRRKGNATLLIGVETNQVDDVLKRIQAACASIAEQSGLPAPRATVFVLNAQQHLRI